MRQDKRELALLIPDRGTFRNIPRQSCIKRFTTPEDAQLAEAENVFVFVPLASLEAVTPFIKHANEKGILRWILLDVGSKEENDLLPTYLNHVKMRNLRNLLLHDDPVVPRRIVNAFCIGAEHDLIADAAVIDDNLFVVSCAAEAFEVPFDEMPSLRDLEGLARKSFVVAEDGSHIAWPDHDVHLDLDSIRFATDEGYRTRAKWMQLVHSRNFGEAISRFRKMSELRQADIPGISERQVRRIEHGEPGSIESFRLLAAAHGMDVNEYLNKVANLASELREPPIGNAGSM